MSDTRRLLPALGLVALGLAGCATSGGAPQVQDLSVSRNSEPPSTYTVKAGDTLYGIAWQNNLDFRDLAQLNGITPPYRIQPGQTLRLDPEGNAQPAAAAGDGATSEGAVATPLGGGQAVSQDDDWLVPDDASSAQTDAGGASLESGAVGAASEAGRQGAPGPVYASSDNDETSRSEDGDTAEDTTPEAEAAADEAPSDTDAGEQTQAAPNAPRDTGAEGDAGTQVAGESDAQSQAGQREYQPVENVAWQWPTEGQVVGGFGDDSSITAGIDIAGEKGQPVKAAGPGIVVYAGSGVRGYGNLIILKHNDHFLSAYAHNDTLRVEENDVVDAGDVIATMGETDADRVKLHFEVRQDGQPQDPMEYLPAR
ncbi:peptidoglycan DD-metalloendopeptidase family protein [Chromohalobacter israelensis]|jgi:lipoprotein NlpD|uniref:peptidoglycan DD-metalloendopeptidase family protein n=1 Tax=Chromohalobacter israelensis TaxID=141390 RepID=UPI000D71878B|nr:peptidoglycan DD-metalloendopeptidase family protein [Chromohalobacter salexigens]PWW34160.1 murein DD-endopeptidase MepM/ murein hydrolase activator NlpD [Chromohalobacter salexigens]